MDFLIHALIIYFIIKAFRSMLKAGDEAMAGKIRLQLFFGGQFWEKYIGFSEGLWHNIEEWTFFLGEIEFEVFSSFPKDKLGIRLVKVRPKVCREEISDVDLLQALAADGWSSKNLF